MAVVSNKRPVMTLYSDAMSAYSHRVRVVLAEKNITVDIIDVDPLDPPDDIMDLNPYGTLPTLVDRDLTLYESRIIMEYLDERFPHPPLLPVDPVSRASARLFMHRVDTDWYTKMDRILAGGAKATAARKEFKESLIAAAPIFTAKPFFMSDDLTLADCSIAPLLWRLPEFGIELPAQANSVLEYAQRMFERESFQESLSEAEREIRS
ncbi:glutathione S-transferase N-terminal domain-containing protein [Pseudomonadota bacterium]